MKKFLSLFLVLTMVLSMLTLPTFAEGEGAGAEAPDYSFSPVVIPKGAATVSYNGTTYTVIRTAADFLAMKGTDGAANYILAQNVDFAGVTFTITGGSTNRNAAAIAGVVNTNFHLEGNGFALNNVTFAPATGGSGLFATGNTAVSHKITNLTVNVADVNFNENGVGFFYGQTFNGSNITFTSVTLNVTKHTQKQGSSTMSGFFVAKAEGPVTFNNCVIGGTLKITNTGNQGNGGFVGATVNANAHLTFNDCDITATYSSNYSATAAYVGFPQKAVTITFNRCDASGDFTLSTTSDGAGVYIGIVYAEGATIDFNDCDISGKVTFNGTKHMGGYIGRVNKTCTITLDNCGATGTYKATSGTVGVMIGNVAQPATVTFDNCDVDNTLTGGASPSGMYLAQVNNSGAKIAFKKCDFVGTLKVTGGKTAAFVGYTNATNTFTDCTVTGTLECTSSQNAGFIGCIDNPGTANITGCTLNASMVFKSNKSGAFIGQAYTSATVDFTNCEMSGLFISASTENGGFMGVAGGAYTSKQDDGTYPEPNRQKAKVTFTGCDTDVFMIGADTVSAYVGSNSAGDPTIVYDDCESNATIYSFGVAGAWYGGDSLYYGYSTNGTNVTVNDNCVNNATIYAVARGEADDCDEGTVNYVDTTVNFTQISAEALADGSYAYTVAQAQKAKGMTTNLVGQTIGTDAQPRVGGAAVEIVTTAKGESVYANGIYTLPGEAEPKSYIQLTPVANNKRNARVIIAVSDEKLAEINTVTITFTLADYTTKTFTVEKNDINSYYAVWAGGEVAEAAEGYVLLAVAIKNIPVGADGANWNVTGNEVQDVVVTVA